MRQKVLKLWKKAHFRFVRLYTWVKSAELKSCGKGVRFDFPVRVENGGSISIGDGCVLYPRVWLNAVSEWRGNSYNGKIQLGRGVMIGYGVQISAAGSIVIDDDVALGAGAVIVDHIHDHRYPDLPIIDSPLSIPEPVRIGKGSFLGVYCLIGPGVQIGEHAVIAANAVVLKDVPAYCIAAGNPARIVRFHSPDAPKAADEEHTEASIA